MIIDTQKQLNQSIEHVESKLKQLGVKLTSIVFACWMIIGSTAIGIMLPAYLVKQALNLKWSKDAVAGIERTKEKFANPNITMAQRAYQPMYQVQSRQFAKSGV